MSHLPSFILLLFFCLTANTLLATHVRGGRIEYTHLNGLTYEARIITYTKISAPSNQADRSQMDLNWGDGSGLETLLRTSTLLVAPDVQENVYVGTHTYSGYGNYVISVSDPNRNDQILNINNGNSLGIPFYVGANLNMPSPLDSNNSARFLTPPIMTAEVGKVFRQSITAYDIDGDILVYSLVTPQQGLGQNIPAYSQLSDIQPGSNNMVSLDAIKGELVWDAPRQVGEYSIAIRVQEYRNCVLVGTTVLDHQIIVGPVVSDHQWVGQNNWSFPAVTPFPYVYEVTPSTPITLGISFLDNNSTVDLEAHSETILSGTATVVSTTTGSNNKDSLTYQWTPTTADLRCAPYIVTFRGKSNYTTELARDIRVAFYVKDSTNSDYCDSIFTVSCFTPIQQVPNASNTTVSIYPNPFHQTCTFQIEAEEAVTTVQLSIFDALGQQVFYQQFEGNSYTYNNPQLPTGLYIYTLQLENGQLVTGKMIKQ